MSIKRNSTYNLVGSLIPIIVALISIPIYLRLIGEARYGVLSIAWLLLGYFGLFDLGLGRATAQRIAALRDGSATERADTFWTALTLNVSLGVIGGLLFWPAASYFFVNVFDVEDILKPEVQAAVPWLVLAVPMATLSGVLTGALQGRERFLELNVISTCGSIFFQVLPLVPALLWGPDLGKLLPAALLARLMTLLVLADQCRRHIFSGHGVTFLPAQAGQLLSFGGWVTVTSFVSPLMVTLDRFVIGATAGAKAVSYFTVPFQLAQRSTIIPNALASALFPRFAGATDSEQQRLTLDALCILLTVMTPLIAIGIFSMKPFLSWWITPEFGQQSALVGQIILMGFWANSFARIPYAKIQACGRPDLVAKCHLAEVLPYMFALYFFLEWFGLVGAAMAFTLRVVIDFILLAWLSDTLKMTLQKSAIPALLVGLALLISLRGYSSLFESFLLMTAHLVITLLWAWLQAPDSVRGLLDSVFKKFSHPIIGS